MATMVDVARLAGVSISTVSHVLNRTRHVEAPTERKVLDAIAATGYRQDALARAMRLFTVPTEMPSISEISS